ncbi:MAG TPA: response regulator transcription factor [Kofleriaceae bacterium]|nr:response regulator transcription factor [Kofleriaceae bacterium]
MESRQRIRAAIVDDQPVFRLGLRAALEQGGEIEVVAETSSEHEAAPLAQEHGAEIALVDLLLTTSATALIRALCAVRPVVRVLVLSAMDKPMRVAEALRAGAAGVAHKRETPEAIRDAVRRVCAGARYLAPSLPFDEVERLVRDPKAWPLERLTTREREVFALMIEGLSSEEMATRLFIARRTVEAHRHHVMHKLGARSIVDLVRIAIDHGIAIA